VGFGTEDLAVVIPTRQRPERLLACLDALAAQTTGGFSVVVVADGTDQRVELGRHAGWAELVVQDHAGPGVARNRGVARAGRPLVLLLGDDMVADPDLVRTHLDGHARRPAAEDVVLGLVAWHPEVARGGIQRWLEWSGAQFDYQAMAHQAGAEVGWSRFYSSNVSLKRELFDRVGGFDANFRFLYEDTDLGWRLGQKGMRLWFEPAALTRHHHRYDWPGLRRRFETTARAERLMALKHAWFEPWFRPRAEEALAAPPASPVWPVVVDRLPPGPWRQQARSETNRWYWRQLAPFFLNAWASEEDLAELQEYLGDDFDFQRLYHHHEEVESELAAAGDEATFYRTSRTYLYDLTAFASWATKIPYRADVARFSPPGSRLLDYGCGTGNDGLRLAEAGYAVDFADFDNPSTEYLRWRLHRRGLEATVYDVEQPVPGHYHLVYCFDVIEHVEDPFAFLHRLEELGDLVAVNFLDPDPADTHLHHRLPVDRLVAHAARRGLLRYRLYHGRSHFVVYRSARSGTSGRRRLRSQLERRMGPRLSGPRPWRLPGAPGGQCWE
jgi:GT2 family glycosyltransferase/SAM-dependent methyltransferase